MTLSKTFVYDFVKMLEVNNNKPLPYYNDLTDDDSCFMRIHTDGYGIHQFIIGEFFNGRSKMRVHAQFRHFDVTTTVLKLTSQYANLIGKEPASVFMIEDDANLLW